MASLDNLTVTVSAADPTVVSAAGQIDSHTSRSLDEVLTAMAVTDAVSVDLAEVTFVDSSGLRVLVQAHKRQLGGGGQLTVVRPSEPVQRLLAITGLTSQLQISE